METLRNNTRSQRLVVYTSIFGKKDAVIPVPKNIDADFYLVTDEIIPPAQMYNGWWTIRGSTSHNHRRNSRHSKMLPHIYFPNHEYSLYVDGNMEIIQDVAKIAKIYLKDAIIAQFYHKPGFKGKQGYIDEANLCINLKKDNHNVIINQVKKYLQEGCPPNLGLWGGASIFRRHNAQSVIDLGELWWNELINHSCRDQISYPYCLWKSGIRPAEINDKKHLFIKKRPHAI